VEKSNIFDAQPPPSKWQTLKFGTLFDKRNPYVSEKTNLYSKKNYKLPTLTDRTQNSLQNYIKKNMGADNFNDK
jgi:hypothetical protein